VHRAAAQAYQRQVYPCVSVRLINQDFSVLNAKRTR
jgi:hypothetical protein